LLGSVVIVIGFYGVMWGMAKESKFVEESMVESSNSPLLQDNTEEHNVVLSASLSHQSLLVVLNDYFERLVETALKCYTPERKLLMSYLGHLYFAAGRHMWLSPSLNVTLLFP
ncbi:hypothetical protein Tco_1480378, partial [Tanacetum coccineum]